ncbi:Por secretion system C-terminal sorting domain-containing protein [Sinomicrobium oceani]|uniref:Por secretion system C-terminal sorting domain-containing protein n=1 Tax=Sinomicrobium oceani TaxID=1150368 RepID=A0A1K1QG40_9FLAO|nr:S8 family peptidase [Sinomicrobium oceani]SFW58619.1 Por secretion system C-terminal sorting domain-containing protein [Sinomicrobium oceani]
MNTKKLLFTLLSITLLSFYGQTVKWDGFLQKNGKGDYVLIHKDASEKLPETYKMVRVLDREHIIVLSPEQQPRYSGNKNSAVPVNDLWKTAPGVDLSASETQHYILKTNDGHSLEEFLSIYDIQADLLYMNYYRIQTSGTFIAEYLLPLPFVTYIGAESLSPSKESDIPDLNLGINKVSLLHQQDPGLTGNTMTLSVKDDRYDIDDIDIAGKHTTSGNEAAQRSAHATDMATIATGRGNTSLHGKGVAPGALLSSSDYHTLYPDADLENLGIFTQNHSYGTTIENFYGSVAEAYDTYIYDHPDRLHLFSSGNAGNQTPPDGSYAGITGYANLTGNFKMAKNIITIGTVNPDMSVPEFSSRGPAYDGRVKPDLVASSSIGTSNANALASGISLLIQQSYKEQHSGMYPPASLVKALLINGADDIGTPGPDFSSGYGNINAAKSNDILTAGQYITGSIRHEEQQEFILAVPPGASQCKITLCWTDPPAQPNANIALVNDLDLRVLHEERSYLPWVLNHEPDKASLERAALQAADHLNTTEQVLTGTVTGSDIRIQIHGYLINEGPQDFSLAYSWSYPGDFQWTHPVAGNSFPYGGENLDFLRWESTLSADTGQLQVSYDLGASWHTLDSEVPLSRGYFSWDPIDEEGHTAMVRILAAGEEFRSPPFLISYALQPRISLKCGDITELSWRTNSAAIAYDLFSLQHHVMEYTTRVTDTTAVISGSSPYHAVAPVYEGGLRGVRSRAISVITDREQCYWESIYATNLEEENSNLLYFSLGSVYRAARIEVFKIVGGEEITIAEISPVNRKTFRITDDEPIEGGNQYRAKLVLDDGSEIYSETVSAIFLARTPFLVFPNPVTAEGISVYSKELEDGKDASIYLYSADGRLMLREQIVSDRDFISLESLANGVYFYRIEVDGKKRKSGGLILYR